MASIRTEQKSQLCIDVRGQDFLEGLDVWVGSLSNVAVDPYI